ncbi:hypothetical protein AVEN_13943-1 [Araneus ventricosus]|uniref:Uncharacterized protein n=1 Tax=Araneus ventricosus TaxID=182803 RepID=A0A4Y2BGQ7_ARAVE|nr:hypothetical protein AVEN_13943-1 [Araneus ventricosus]
MADYTQIFDLLSHAFRNLLYARRHDQSIQIPYEYIVYQAPILVTFTRDDIAEIPEIGMSRDPFHMTLEARTIEIRGIQLEYKERNGIWILPVLI